MSEDSEESTKFIRQRRDLFVISGLLLLIEFADITVKQVSLIGMNIDVGNPKVLKYSLWIIWAYWYLRYIQAYLALRRNLVNEVYRNLLYNYSFERFKSRVTEETQKIWDTKIKEFDLTPDAYKLIRDSTNSELRWNKASFSYDLSAKSKVGGKSSLIDMRTDVISGFPYAWIQIKTISNLIFRNIEFTEYFFPFIFGLLPPVVWAIMQYSC